jgi:hypothetical protein
MLTVLNLLIGLSIARGLDPDWAGLRRERNQQSSTSLRPIRNRESSDASQRRGSMADSLPLYGKYYYNTLSDKITESTSVGLKCQKSDQLQYEDLAIPASLASEHEMRNPLFLLHGFSNSACKSKAVAEYSKAGAAMACTMVKVLGHKRLDKTRHLHPSHPRLTSCY